MCTPAQRAALGLPADGPPFSEGLLAVFEEIERGEASAANVIQIAGVELTARDETGAAKAVLAHLEDALSVRHKYLALESLRWVKVEVPSEASAEGGTVALAVPSLMFAGVTFNVSVQVPREASAGSVFLVPHPEVDWNQVDGTLPPQFLEAPYTPFDGEYAGQDRTGLLPAVASAKRALASTSASNPTMSTVRDLRLRECNACLDAIEDLRSPFAFRSRQAGARDRRAVEEVVHPDRQAAATSSLLSGLERSTGTPREGGAATRSPEHQLKRKPGAVRRAATNDLEGRAKQDAAVKPWQHLDWAERLRVVEDFERAAAAEGMSPAELAERRRVERGDPPFSGGGCDVM
jgi:hypothetical protein